MVGPLIAVAIELRQTQSSLQAQAYQSRAFDGIATNRAMAQDEELARLNELVYEFGFDAARLSMEKRRKVVQLLAITRIDLDKEHYQFQQGLLDPSFYHGVTVEWTRAAVPIRRASGKIEPRPDFREGVDHILADVH